MFDARGNVEAAAAILDSDSIAHSTSVAERLELRLRLAEVQLKIEHRDQVSALVEDLRPMLKRAFPAQPPTEGIYDGPLYDRPTVVCLCGSTRFMDEFFEAGWRETLAGKIVLSVGVSKHLPPDHGGESLGSDVVERLDELHLRKIELADEVLVLNVGGYVGESTTAEVRHAFAIGRLVRWLEPSLIPSEFVTVTMRQTEPLR